MLSFMQAQRALFQQGYSLLDDVRPYMKNLAAQVRPRPAFVSSPFGCPQPPFLYDLVFSWISW